MNPEEKKARNREACRRYAERNKEKIREKGKKYYQANKEKCKDRHKRWVEEHKEYMKEYRNQPIRRAYDLVCAYNSTDKKHNRGQGDLTKEWLLENILMKPCAHCGKVGWDVIGCNRLDNSKPHSKDNVEPCCEECNKRLWYNRNRGD